MSTVLWSAACTSSLRHTSQRTAIARAPDCSISSAVSWLAPSARSATTTLAPARAKASAAARPMPLAAPVTKATLPAKLPSSFIATTFVLTGRQLRRVDHRDIGGGFAPRCASVITLGRVRTTCGTPTPLLAVAPPGAGSGLGSRSSQPPTHPHHPRHRHGAWSRGGRPERLPLFLARTRATDGACSTVPHLLADVIESGPGRGRRPRDGVPADQLTDSTT